MGGSRPRSIGEVAKVCFGYRGKLTVLVLTWIFQIAKCGVYFVVIGTNMHFWIETVTHKECALVGALLCMPLIFLRDITVISRWSAIGVVASVFYLLTITAGGLRAAVAQPSEDWQNGLWPVNGRELPLIFAVMLYAYSPADILPVLKNDMKDPNDLPVALCWSHGVVALIYVSLGAIGYF